MIYQNIIELIGNTPMVRINKILPTPKSPPERGLREGVNIYAKLEGFNPGGSIKDRIALKMIEQAEKNGDLTKDKTIIEPTSGNTGIALAMIGAVKGYNVEIVMSEAVSIERRKMIQAFGGSIVLTDPNKGTDGAIIKARELVKEKPEEYFMPDQFSNEYNKLAHYENTAEEIWKDTEGKIDYFVSAIGTSGTIMGVGSNLKKRNPNIKVVSAEPVKGHYIQGLKNMEEAIVPALYNRDLIDEIIMIDTEEAFEIARKVTKEEGISIGMSSGAAMLASLKLAEKIEKGNIVTIFPDRGEKYLSTKLFS